MAPGTSQAHAGGAELSGAFCFQYLPVTKAALGAASISGAFPAGNAALRPGPRDGGRSPFPQCSSGPTVIFSN